MTEIKREIQIEIDVCVHPQFATGRYLEGDRAIAEQTADSRQVAQIERQIQIPMERLGHPNGHIEDRVLVLKVHDLDGIVVSDNIPIGLTGRKLRCIDKLHGDVQVARGLAQSPCSEPCDRIEHRGCTHQGDVLSEQSEFFWIG